MGIQHGLRLVHRRRVLRLQAAAQGGQLCRIKGRAEEGRCIHEPLRGGEEGLGLDGGGLRRDKACQEQEG